MTYAFIYPVLPEARKLQSLRGIESDMQQVVAYCDLLDEMLRNHVNRPELWEAISYAAVVRYTRCFQSGIRERMNSTPLADLGDEATMIHQYFYDLRDKHIAHSVGGYEENQLRARVSIENEKLDEVISVDVVNKQILGFSSSDLPAMRKLAEWWLIWLHSEQQREEDDLVKKLNALPKGKLEAWRVPAQPEFLNENAHRVRRKAP